jgi:predicted MFS family arabinose efflux permease
MKYLKTLSIISFLLINGLGEHGIPTFAGIGLCVYQFLSDILEFIHNNDKEISWLLGLIGISAIIFISIILLSKQYKDRYLLVLSFAALLSIQIYMSGVLRYYNKVEPWFIFPLLAFIITTIIIIVKNFKAENLIKGGSKSTK